MSVHVSSVSLQVFPFDGYYYSIPNRQYQGLSDNNYYLTIKVWLNQLKTVIGQQRFFRIITAQMTVLL
mgnify:CR=1 FL=1